METRVKRVYIVQERHLLFSLKDSAEDEPSRAPGVNQQGYCGTYEEKRGTFDEVRRVKPVLATTARHSC